MSSKMQFYSSLAEHATGEVTANHVNWTLFLNTAAKLYKYPFQDQLIIHAQRPDATACAELELWNKHFNRWVRRGSKGIAIIDNSGDRPRLKYVFDVSDTEKSKQQSRSVNLWELQQEKEKPVLEGLAKKYEDISDCTSLTDAFSIIASQLVREYESSDFTLRTEFEDVLSNSVMYTVMTRCGLDTADYINEARGRADRNGNAGLALTEDMCYDAGMQTQRAVSLCEDIILENAKLSLIELAESFDNAEDMCLVS